MSKVRLASALVLIAGMALPAPPAAGSSESEARATEFKTQVPWIYGPEQITGNYGNTAGVTQPLVARDRWGILIGSINGKFSATTNYCVSLTVTVFTDTGDNSETAHQCQDDTTTSVVAVVHSPWVRVKPNVTATQIRRIAATWGITWLSRNGETGNIVAEVDYPVPEYEIKDTADQRRARRILSMPMSKFLGLKKARASGLDWSDDGCSAPVPNGWSSKFEDACARHDFGYRNLGASTRDSLQLAATDLERRAIDQRFKADMLAACRDRPQRGCSTAARVFFQAVRTQGAKIFYKFAPRYDWPGDSDARRFQHTG